MSEKETAFLGKITAGMTHEFMNVLATIGQTSGLMEDLLVLCREASFPHHEKFTKILTAIKKQVGRGTEIGVKLKDFAHSMDEIPKKIGVNELMEHVVFIMQRFANLKKMKIDFSPLEKESMISVDQFRLEMTIAKCMEKCLEHANEGDVIMLRSEKMAGEIAFRIFIESQSHVDGHAIAEELSDIEETLNTLDARIKPISKGSFVGLEFVLPL